MLHNQLTWSLLLGNSVLARLDYDPLDNNSNFLLKTLFKSLHKHLKTLLLQLNIKSDLMKSMNGLNVPNHLGVILDGNRRWARERGLKPWEGHKAGRDVAEKFLDWSLELGIKQVSMYVLSTENLNRSPRELKEIFSLVAEILEIYERKQSLLEKYDVKVRFIGDLNRLPAKVRKIIGKVMEKTAHHQKRFLNIMIAYGSHYEFTNVVKKLVEKGVKIGKIEVTPKEIQKNLLVPVPLDLLIRTGGMQRLSGFMMWQAAYAEIYFTKTLWPDFTKKELIKAIKWYNSVRRNFGK